MVTGHRKEVFFRVQSINLPIGYGNFTDAGDLYFVYCCDCKTMHLILADSNRSVHIVPFQGGQVGSTR